MSGAGKILMELDAMRTFSESGGMTFGHGRLLKEERIVLPALMPEKETGKEPQVYGILFLKPAGGAEYFSRSAWPLAEKQVLLNGLI